jgi:polyribonucleotide nucleotidyltransferase
MYLNEEIVHEFEFEGVECSLSTGKVAKRATASVVGRMGETVVLVTVCTDDPMEGADYFPMHIEYIERYYAGGLISSSRFVKRERHPSTGATLKARMIDRAVRSRFPEGYRNSVQIIINVLSYDEDNDPLIIGSAAASTALTLAGTPFNGPTGIVRVGYFDDEVSIYNVDVDYQPEDEDEKSPEEKIDMNFVMGTDGEVITMIDADSKEVPEDVIVKGMQMGLEKSKPIIEAQKELVSKVEKVKPIERQEYESYAPPQELVKKVKEDMKDKIQEALFMDDRQEKENALDDLKEELFEEYEGEYAKSVLRDAFGKVAKKIVQTLILEEQKRTDGRPLDEIRKLAMEVDVLPRAHGSALFSRGDTQTLTVTTLGSRKLAQLQEGIEGESTRRYIHHYNAPSFTVGETGRYRFHPGRREIGHGALAEKALLPVLPDQEKFPYTIRVVNDIMAQSGSSSMASVCGATLSLMDAGVPIKKPVAGIAMGVIANEDMSKYIVLTDIAEYEDFYGHMDFKVTGTRDGITAIQMDNKREGLPIEIFEDALEGAKEARIFLIEEMEKVIDKPRVAVSQYAPKIDVMKVAEEKIGDIIGPGGKIIKGITEKTGAEVNIDDDGTVSISAVSEESRKSAVKMVEGIIEEPEVGKVYKGVVGTIKDFGIFVDVSPNISGLVHISEMADKYVEDPSKLVSIGDEVKVKIIGIDDKGRVKMSMKQV